MSFFSIDDFQRWQKWMIENGYMRENEHEFLMNFLYTQAFEEGNLQLRSSERSNAVLVISDYYYPSQRCRMIISGSNQKIRIIDYETDYPWYQADSDAAIVIYFHSMFDSLMCESEHQDTPCGNCNRCHERGRFHRIHDSVSVQNLTMPWVFNTRRWVMS
jgi:hypothetical protein